jgi:hypothetical protein
MTTGVGGAARIMVSVAAALTLLTGCTTLNGEQNAVPTTVPSQLEVRPTPTPSVTAPSDSPAIPLHRATVPPLPPQAAAPARVQVDWAGVTAPVVAVGVDTTGQMALPPDPKEAGWYRFSAAPSSQEGTTVLAAHVDAVGYGIGPFAHLVDMPKGTRITITDTAGRRTVYTVDSVSLLTKTAIPWANIFTDTGAHRLVLVTCGGAFDYQSHHYLSNLIITAA